MAQFPEIVPLIAAIASSMLAVVVYLRAPDRRLGIVFAVLATALVFWNLNFFVLYGITDYDTAFLYSWILRTGAVFLLPAILQLSLVLPGRPIALGWTWILGGAYAWAAMLAILNVRGLLVESLAHFRWGYYSVGTKYYDLFPLLVLYTFILGIGYLAREYWTTDDTRIRQQLRFWILGFALSLPLGLTNLLPSYGIPVYPLGNLAVALWAGVVAYGIVRYRLMDIELVVAKSLAYVGASLVVVGPAAVVALVFQRRAFAEIHFDLSALLILLLLVVGLLFSRVRLSIESRLEKSLFPQKTESRSRLIDLAEEVVKILDRDRLLEVVSTAVEAAFSLETLALYLREDVRGQYELQVHRGGRAVPPDVAPESALVRWLALRGEPALRGEASATGADSGGGRAGEIMRVNEWEACVPFVGGQDLIGFLCLGKKAARQAYSTGDMALLAKVGAEAAIALQNARLYLELRRSREIINRTGRLSALGTLAAGIAHEIRNPLVSIQTFFQLAPDRLDDEEFMTSFLRLAETEVQRISSLISELLMFAKSPTATLGETDLEEAVQRTVVLLEPQARAARVALRWARSGGLRPVLADSDQVMQVFINLALNAIQATPEGGEVSLEAREIVHEGSRYCQVEIRDTGSGISDSIKEAIFDPFFTTKDRGSGLGLAVSYQLVSEVGGFIAVESQEGRGSRFIVNFPALNMAGADCEKEGG